MLESHIGLAEVQEGHRRTLVRAVVLEVHHTALEVVPAEHRSLGLVEALVEGHIRRLEVGTVSLLAADRSLDVVVVAVRSSLDSLVAVVRRVAVEVDSCLVVAGKASLYTGQLLLIFWKAPACQMYMRACLVFAPEDTYVVADMGGLAAVHRSTTCLFS